MCGRYTHLYTWKQLHRLLNLLAQPPEESLKPSWNVAPTQAAPVVSLDKDGNRIGQYMQWGFAPAWATQATTRPINARCETVATSPLFRAAFRSTRCIVPVSGFYEWMAGMTSKIPKQPYYITLLNDPIMYFAGLWTPPQEAPEASQNQLLPTFTILTTTANEAMQKVHSRMPVILTPQQVNTWLAAGPLSDTHLEAVFEPYPSESIGMVPVSSQVNKPAHNEPTNIERSEQPKGLFG